MSWHGETDEAVVRPMLCVMIWTCFDEALCKVLTSDLGRGRDEKIADYEYVR